MSDLPLDHLDRLPDGSLSREEVRVLTAEVRRLREVEATAHDHLEKMDRLLDENVRLRRIEEAAHEVMHDLGFNPREDGPEYRRLWEALHGSSESERTTNE